MNCFIMLKEVPYKAIHKDVPPEMKDRDQYICKDCGSVFLSRGGFRNHQSYVHLGRYKRKGIIGGKSKSYPCPDCGKILFSQRRLKEHIQKQHEKNAPFECDQCKSSFINARNLRNHKNQVHTRQKCDICEQEICNVFMLKRHKASAHGQFPVNSFPCQFCSLFFFHKKNLVKHVEKKHKDSDLDDLEFDDGNIL